MEQLVIVSDRGAGCRMAGQFSFSPMAWRWQRRAGQRAAASLTASGLGSAGYAVTAAFSGAPGYARLDFRGRAGNSERLPQSRSPAG